MKKLLSILLAVSLILTSAGLTVMAKNETVSTDYAVDTLCDLGILIGDDAGNLQLDKPITRAEYATILLRVLGLYEDNIPSAAPSFIDVPQTHWASGIIAHCAGMKIINGYGDGRFGPDDIVEYQDAITMLVRTLGYEPAIGNDKYPTGYLTKAGDLGLTVGVNGYNGGEIKRIDVAHLIFNALDVPLMTQSSYGTFTQYVINDGYSSTNGTINVKKTLLSEKHNIVKVQGVIENSTIITSTSNTGLATVLVDVTNDLNNKFNVDDGRMYTGMSGAENYVGKKCIIFIYHNEFENENTIISLYETKAVDTLTVDIKDIYSLDNTSCSYYDENNRLRTIKLYPINSYINGVNVNDIYNFSDYDGKLSTMSGKIEFALLNSNINADYDTVYITAEKPFVVNEVNTKTSVIRAKNKIGIVNRIVFDETDGNIEATLENGNWKDIEENDVLMVSYIKTTQGKEIYNARLINNTVEGKITGISGTGSTREITINGYDYGVISGVENEKTLKAGDLGIFYLDVNNNIVYFDTTITSNNNYGYVIAVKEPSNTDLISNYQMKVLTKENEIVIYDVYKTIRHNQTTKKIEDFTEFSTLANTLISYSVNANNEINVIETAVSDTIDNFEDYFTVNAFSGDLTDYDPDDMSFGKYSISEDTVIFYVADSKNPEVVSLPALAEDDVLKDVKLYNVDDDNFVGAIVINGSTTIGHKNNNAIFVTKVVTTIDEDGNTIYAVSGYKNLEPVTYKAETASEALIGKLVTPHYLPNGKIKNFNPVNTIYTLKEIDSNKLTMNDNTVYKIRNNTNVYVFDENKVNIGRDFYEIDADGYLDYDDIYGIYYGTNVSESNLNVEVCIYEFENKIVDIVFIIKK